MIATLAEVSLDSADPEALIGFYQRVLGGEVDVVSADFVVLRLAGIAVTSSRVADYRRPTWPHSTVPKQVHLDLRVGSLDAAELALVAAGAHRADHQPHPDQYRVFLDPAGHPFCACLPADWVARP
ncbi:VOC family protein [Pengzhenrongella frigida]|uniref:VOC family protein n=1 Tax=Pengzhenrongella frigida TaxID=1259133 RepID=A0A4V1ZGT6_9MICO|nr:VOC family protein [Cellulomonas sp. HLT2-17]RYV49674.1 VOC family protein [Cellulomonas sp. HLT2-17]